MLVDQIEVGPAQARALWQAPDETQWDRAHKSYAAVVTAQEIKGLGALDDWYCATLPALVAQRNPPFIEREELIEVSRWKMMRGEWRARNLTLVRSNKSDIVRGASSEAFALAPDPRKPAARLAELTGVGPATASAVLAAFRPDLYPFLDELIGAAIEELGAPQFTLPYYVRYAAALNKRAAELGTDWTAQRVGQALWAASGGKAAL